MIANQYGEDNHPEGRDKEAFGRGGCAGAKGDEPRAIGCHVHKRTAEHGKEKADHADHVWVVG